MERFLISPWWKRTGSESQVSADLSVRSQDRMIGGGDPNKYGPISGFGGRVPSRTGERPGVGPRH